MNIYFSASAINKGGQPAILSIARIELSGRAETKVTIHRSGV